jgi:hypothetical protein
VPTKDFEFSAQTPFVLFDHGAHSSMRVVRFGLLLALVLVSSEPTPSASGDEPVSDEVVTQVLDEANDAIEEAEIAEEKATQADEEAKEAELNADNLVDQAAYALGNETNGEKTFDPDEQVPEDEV